MEMFRPTPHILFAHLAGSIFLAFIINWVLIRYNICTDIFTLDSSLSIIDDSLDARINCDLVVGVMSSRYNFEQRNSIRKTWWLSLSLFDDNFDNVRPKHCVKAWFVVGNQRCDVHPADRIDENGCSPLMINMTEANSSNYSQIHLLSKIVGINRQQIRHTSNELTTKFQSRLMFKIHHGIVINKLGLINVEGMSKSEHSNTACRKVIIVDATSEEIVTQACVGLKSETSGVIADGYLYRSVEPVLLPSGFAGILVADITMASDEEIRHIGAVSYDNAGGLITLTHVTSIDGELHPFDKDNMILTASFGFLSHDFELTRRHIDGRAQRWLEWNAKLDEQDKMLADEMSNNGDLVGVDVLDVYRNLPGKLLAFYAWAIKRYRFSYAIKVDDDTFLNLRDVVEAMLSLPLKRQWWGNFRQNWGVERHGKWAETTYRSITYPPFACGAAYAVSAHLVKWLTDNRHVLHPFQGEDVSMGIWLAPLNPTTVHDTRWSCADECTFPGQSPRSPTFSRGQLSPELMNAAWISLKRCRKLCDCDRQKSL